MFTCQARELQAALHERANVRLHIIDMRAGDDISVSAQPHLAAAVAAAWVPGWYPEPRC